MKTETKKLFIVEIHALAKTFHVAADNIQQVTEEYPKADNIKIVTNYCHVLSENHPTNH